MITIIDYDTGNLQSVINAFHRVGADYKLSSSAGEITRAEKVLLPGVGAAAAAMDKLREKGLVETVRSLTQPVLGICLGMQLMCDYSEEGDTRCLGIFENKIRFFDTPGLKVPHMGWNSIYNLRSPLYEGVEEESYVYFVHSYAAEVNRHTIATTDYGVPFSASLHRDNFYGAQFHPEKSSGTGEQILRNFLRL